MWKMSTKIVLVWTTTLHFTRLLLLVTLQGNKHNNNNNNNNNNDMICTMTCCMRIRCDRIWEKGCKIFAKNDCLCVCVCTSVGLMVVLSCSSGADGRSLVVELWLTMWYISVWVCECVCGGWGEWRCVKCLYMYRYIWTEKCTYKLHVLYKYMCVCVQKQRKRTTLEPKNRKFFGPLNFSKLLGKLMNKTF